MKREFPDLSKPELAAKVSHQWRDLSEEERGFYKDMAKENTSSISKSSTQKSQNCRRSLDSGDPEANKKKFVKFLENMKSKHDPNAKKLMKKTIATSPISLQHVTDSFWDR